MSNRQLRRELRRSGQVTRAGARRPTPPSRGGGSSSLLSFPFIAGVAVLVLVLVGLLVWFSMSTGGGDGGSEAVAEIEQGSALIAELKEMGLVDGTSVGREDAPLHLEAYEDFQCPFCLRFTAFQEGQLLEQYVKTGQLRLTYRHFPVFSGRESVQAAQASLCAAEQNAFWEYHHKLFRVQAEAGQIENERINVGRFSDENLKRYAQELGLDMERFNACFDSDKYLDQVQKDKAEGQSYGLTGTPSFVLNGRPLVGGAPQTIDGWKSIFDQVLGSSSSPTPAPTETPTANPTAAATPTP
ncbi:Disulfide bond formation protein D [bacterium HR29]|jgi:protein-disulfide isomerase|nr:Disulfide bond formation protein D [bacterium HR29]